MEDTHALRPQRPAQYVGSFGHAVDTKGRVVIPSAFRDQFEATMVLVFNVDGCLSVYSYAGWDAYLQDFKSRNDSTPRTRALLRTLNSLASPIELDKAGRITLPAHLRTQAGIDKDVVVAGNGATVEIWDATTHESMVAHSTADALADLATLNLGWGSV